MARGNTCPSCGKLTFHRHKKKPAVRVCSDCKVVGWIDGTPLAPGAGSGKTCLICTERKKRKIFTRADRFTIDYCYGCKAVTVSNAN